MSLNRRFVLPFTVATALAYSQLRVLQMKSHTLSRPVVRRPYRSRVVRARHSELRQQITDKDADSGTPGSLRRAVDGVAGLMFVVLGVAGAILPGLPATPFLLLASWFWGRSFPKVNGILLRSPVVGRIINDWQQNRRVRRCVKARAIVLVAVSLIATVIFSPFPVTITMLLPILMFGCVGAFVVASLPED